MAKVIRIHEHGSPLVMRFEDDDLRAPGNGEVRIKQQVIGVNYVDAMVRDGRFPASLPTVLGFEGAGVVESVGPGTAGFRVGDRVGYFFSAGAYATERLIEASALTALPADISTEQAATFLAKGLTAWMGLRALHTLRSGEIVLVQGASGSVGAILSRWSKALGATVIGVAGSEGKLGKVKASADYALHSSDPAFLDRVREAAPHGVDVVFDFVGKATFEQSAAALRDGGEIIAIGSVSGPPQTSPERLARRRIAVKSGGTPEYVNASTVGQATAELFQAIRDGLFADLDVARYPFAEAARTHEDMAARCLFGLPVLIP